MSCRNMWAHRMRVHVPTDRSSIDSCIVAVRTPDAGRRTPDAGAGHRGCHVLTVPGETPGYGGAATVARPSAAWGIVPTTQALRGRCNSEPVVTVHELMTGANPTEVDPVGFRDRR